eukprot:1160364-Pelagomonas_calceolata.AAC.1
MTESRFPLRCRGGTGSTKRQLQPLHICRCYHSTLLPPKFVFEMNAYEPHGEALASLLVRGPFLNARSWTWLV